MIYNQIRNYIVIFGRLFTNIEINRKNDEGEIEQNFRVPLSYAPKQKYYIWAKQPRNERPFSILIPRISFINTALEMDTTRKINVNNKIQCYNSSDPSKMKYILNPVPYNFTFSVSVWAKNQDGLYQIIEKIISNFTPTQTLSIVEAKDELSINRDISIDMNDNSLDIDAELTEEASSLRVLMWDFTFTLKGYLYPQEVKEVPIIKKVITNVKGYEENVIEDEKIFFQSIDEVYPYDSIKTDDYQVKRTVTDSEGENISYYDKAEEGVV